jgi:hypothetical protein
MRKKQQHCIAIRAGIINIFNLCQYGNLKKNSTYDENLEILRGKIIA